MSALAGKMPFLVQCKELLPLWFWKNNKQNEKSLFKQRSMLQSDTTHAVILVVQLAIVQPTLEIPKG